MRLKFHNLLCALCSGETLNIPIHVFGPETHMTAIVGMALGKKPIQAPVQQQSTTANFLLPGSQVVADNNVLLVFVI